MTIEELQNKKVAILGLGVNNRALATYLLERGVALTIRDRSANVQEEFSRQYPQHTDKVSWQIGEKILQDLSQFAVVFRTPSIPFLSPELQKFAKGGGEIYSQTKLFFDLSPAAIIGVTGTNGKGTTCTLIQRILEAGYSKGKVYLAGNIGADPFSFLADLKPEDLVILELSSFQLQDMKKSPHVAVLLKITSDHLDHHKSEQEYLQAKRQILLYQNSNDLAIVNADTPGVEKLLTGLKSQVFLYSKFKPRRQSAWVDYSSGQEVVFIQFGEKIQSFVSGHRVLLGEHNLENILAAVLVATYYSIDLKIIEQVVCTFTGLPHRLSFIGRANQVDFYNDSVATTPPPTLAALEVFAGRRIHLILGGNDKGQDHSQLAEAAVQKCATVSLMPGTTSKKLLPLLRRSLAAHKESKCLILDKAQIPLMPTLLSGIHPHLLPEDVVLLSPAGLSFASYANYKERGEDFIAAVKDRYPDLL